MDGKGHDRLHEPPHLRQPLRRTGALRPDWHSDDDDHRALKVVMTGSASDEGNLQPHTHQKAPGCWPKRLADPDRRAKLVIVRDMWLTGFDAPCLHTMYVDKPMRAIT
jgi:type I restriction enzyme R subunit